MVVSCKLYSKLGKMLINKYPLMHLLFDSPEEVVNRDALNVNKTKILIRRIFEKASWTGSSARLASTIRAVTHPSTKGCIQSHSTTI